VKAARDTWYMIGRQARNLLREPIWIAILLVQPMVWLLLYGQLFKNVTRLGGFGTDSYITFLAPAIVVMNAFFSASWSGMSMVFDIERKFVERFLATPASRLSIVLSQIVRSALTAAIQGVIILLVAAVLGVRVHSGLAGWVVILLVAMLVNAAFTPSPEDVAFWKELDRLTRAAEASGDRVLHGDPNQGEGHEVHIAHVATARKLLGWARELGIDVS